MKKKGQIWAVVVAAGSGARMGDAVPKQYLPLAGRPVLAHALQTFQSASSVDGIVLVADDVAPGSRACLIAGEFPKVKAVVRGGARRQDSVARGLASLGPDAVDLVLVHDGARPLVSIGLVERCIEQAMREGSAVPVVPVRETVRRVGADAVPRTVDRSGLFAVQTPQAFRLSLLLMAFKHIQESGIDVTDEAHALETAGTTAKTIAGERSNLKITDRDDMEMAGALLAERERSTRGAGHEGFRVGLGYDVHPFKEGRPLVLGGISIPWPRGLDGHSDADVLAHAVCDACLGAACLGDIGVHFPNTDPAYRGISSLVLLGRVRDLVAGAGYRVTSIDAVVVAEEPKIKEYIPAMQQALAEASGVPPGAFSIKATTSEGLGFVGRREGIACQAVAVLAREGCFG